MKSVKFVMNLSKLEIDLLNPSIPLVSSFVMIRDTVSYVSVLPSFTVT